MDDSDALRSTVAVTGERVAMAHTLTAARSGGAAGPGVTEPVARGRDRYELREEIGAGGMGRVVSAIDRQFASLGMREAMGNLVVGSAFAATQLMAWGVARRRTLLATNG